MASRATWQSRVPADEPEPITYPTQTYMSDEEADRLYEARARTDQKIADWQRNVDDMPTRTETPDTLADYERTTYSLPNDEPRPGYDSRGIPYQSSGTSTSDPTTSSAGPGEVNPSVNENGEKGSALGSDTDTSATSTQISKYDSGGGRLTEFAHADAKGDESRLGYITLIADDKAFADLAQNPAVNKEAVKAILKELKGKYTKFIFNAVSLQRQEHSMVVPTFGDSYAAIFTGKKPGILGISGSLVFDYSKSDMSWYLAFLHAYEYYLRGSRLAKWKAKVKLVFPDFVEYTGYIMDMSDAVHAEQDNVINVSFSFLIAEQNFYKPKVDKEGSAQGSTTPPTKKVGTATANDVPPALSPASLNSATNATIPLVGDKFRSFVPNTLTAGIVADNGVLDSIMNKTISGMKGPLGKIATDFGGIINPQQIQNLAGKIFSQRSIDGISKTANLNMLGNVVAREAVKLGGMGGIITKVSDLQSRVLQTIPYGKRNPSVYNIPLYKRD